MPELFETPKSKVYILTDDLGRITRCEGGYTESNIKDASFWKYIDEGTGDRYNLCQSHYFDGGLYTMDGIPRYKYEGGTAVLRTDAEIEADRQPTTEQLAADARVKRDELLAETDWTQVLDAPIDTTTRDAYRVYRQALRDVPAQEGFPAAIVWPELPAVVKAAPDPVDEAVDVLLGGDTNA